MPGAAPNSPPESTGPAGGARSSAEPDLAKVTRLDPRRLLVFREVGHGGSMASAARALGWTQPAVSKHVRRLERDLGLPLTVRVGRGLALTDAGQLLLGHADSLATGLAAAGDAMTELAGMRSGHVRLAAFPSASATIVADAVTTLAAAHPNLDVRLTQAEPPEALLLLTRGEVDIAVVFDYADQPDRVVHPGTASVALMHDDLRIVIPVGHPLGDRPALSLPDLATERWIAGCPNCSQHLLRSAARAGFIPDIRHSTDDYVVVQALVAAGVAVAILPSLALAASRRSDVRDLPLTNHPPRTVTAEIHANTQTAPALATALEHLTRAAHCHLPLRAEERHSVEPPAPAARTATRIPTA